MPWWLRNVYRVTASPVEAVPNATLEMDAANDPVDLASPIPATTHAIALIKLGPAEFREALGTLASGSASRRSRARSSGRSTGGLRLTCEGRRSSCARVGAAKALT